VKIHTKYVNGPQVSENTTYMKGVRQRVEFPGVTIINQCDLTRSVQVHDATRRFMVVPADSPAAQMPGPPAGPATASQAAATPAGSTPSGQPPVAPKPQGGVITETVTLTDTGERTQMFGLEARHITTLIVRQPGPNACDSRTTTIETDGWYADLPERPACPPTPVSTPPPPPASDACIDRVETRQVGDARMGVALSTTITTAVNDAPRGSDGHSPDSPDHAGNGNRATVSMSVTDLEITTLAAALFDVPPGYTEVKSYQELLPSLASGGSLADAVFGSLADGTSAVAPKKPGITRIGIVDPIDKSGRTLPIAMLRSALIGSLSRGTFEALPVGGATAAELDHDATAKAADFILVSEIGEVKVSKPGKVGSVLRRVSGDANAASDLYDAHVDYKLYAIGDQSRPKVAASAKASSGTTFGVGSALKVATFAGSMYVGTMTGGMLGFSPFGASPFGSLGGSPFGGLGAFSALSHLGLAGSTVMANAGAIAAGGMAGRAGGMSAVMHPGMGAAAAIMSHGAQMAVMAGGMSGAAGLPGGMHGLPDPSTQKAAQVVQDALSQAGKQVVEELGKSKRSS
jgi:hypothetical protein